MIPNLGPTELVILLAILLLFFGAGRIPALARSIGTGARELRHGISDTEDKHANRSKERETDVSEVGGSFKGMGE